MIRRILFSIAFIAALKLQAEVRLPGVFTDNMVLQQGMALPVWGWADNGDKVTVEFGGKKVSATAKDGKWSLKLPKFSASDKPQTFTVSTKSKTIQLTNVLVGDVWICSGQSNMKFRLVEALGATNDMASATNASIRLFLVPEVRTNVPQTDVATRWELCSPESVRMFSAVGYYFGRDLQSSRKVPIGLIDSAWGGTPAEAWTPYDTMAANLDFGTNFIATREKIKANFPNVVADYQKKKELAKAEHRPFSLRAPFEPWQAGELYNGMIAPFVPYAIQGAIWYQGEANAGAAKQYRTLFPMMISSWRKNWGQGDFTFLCVQLAPWDNFRKRTVEEVLKHPAPKETWPELREAQWHTTKVLPKVGMAVTTDVGDKENIHPKNKQPVGARLALAARAIAYGEKIEFSDQLYRQMKVDDGKAVVYFDHVGKGLEAHDGELKGFAICGADKNFVWAKAEIVGDTVVVSSPEVAAPVAVRYGWADFPIVNLWNKDGLPASPFRTDDPGDSPPAAADEAHSAKAK